jgi:hypothetical protein
VFIDQRKRKTLDTNPMVMLPIDCVGIRIVQDPGNGIVNELEKSRRDINVARGVPCVCRTQFRRSQSVECEFDHFLDCIVALSSSHEIASRQFAGISLHRHWVDNGPAGIELL